MYRALVERLAGAIPDLGLGTDLIVGHPGEADDDFEATLRVVERAAVLVRSTCSRTPTGRGPRRRGRGGHVPPRGDPRAEQRGCGRSGAPKNLAFRRALVGRRREALVLAERDRATGLSHGAHRELRRGALRRRPTDLARRFARRHGSPPRARTEPSRRARGGGRVSGKAAGAETEGRGRGGQCIGGSGLYEMEGLEDIRWVSVQHPVRRAVRCLLRRAASADDRSSSCPATAAATGSRPSRDQLPRQHLRAQVARRHGRHLGERGGQHEGGDPSARHRDPRPVLRPHQAARLVLLRRRHRRHVGMADPVCRDARGRARDGRRARAARAVHRGGTYICIEGPQFSTQGRVDIYRRWGVSVIGMTNMPEAKLAREAELCYATLALATDYDVWHEEHEAVTVEAVVANLLKNVATANVVLGPRDAARGQALRRRLRRRAGHARSSPIPRPSRRAPASGSASSSIATSRRRRDRAWLTAGRARRIDVSASAMRSSTS